MTKETKNCSFFYTTEHLAECYENSKEGLNNNKLKNSIVCLLHSYPSAILR